MENRILTIQIEIVDKTEAEWIWDNHMNHDNSHGIHVTAIHNGPITELDEEDDI